MKFQDYLKQAIDQGAKEFGIRVIRGEDAVKIRLFPLGIDSTSEKDFYIVGETAIDADGQQGFADAVFHDNDMSIENKLYWLYQAAKG